MKKIQEEKRKWRHPEAKQLSANKDPNLGGPPIPPRKNRLGGDQHFFPNPVNPPVPPPIPPRDPPVPPRIRLYIFKKKSLNIILRIRQILLISFFLFFSESTNFYLFSE